jgi:hypothetical protein
MTTVLPMSPQAPVPSLVLIPTVLIALGAILVLVIWLFDTTDIPHIRGLATVPGVPLLGSLAQLGTEQPRRLAELSKKYGPVFQIRLGNKVRDSHHTGNGAALKGVNQEIRRCQQLRFHQTTLDQQSIQLDIPTYSTHVSQCFVELSRLHHRHFAMGRVLQTTEKGGRRSGQSTFCCLLHAFCRSGGLC